MENHLKHNFLRRWWRVVDQQSIIAVIVLFCFSLFLVTTASPAVANRIGLIDNYFSTRQVIFLFVACLVILALSLCNKTQIKRIAILGFLFSLVMLVLVKFIGFEVKGATRWINIFGFSYQPSEFMKPFFAVVTGWILSLRYKEEFPSFRVSGVLYLTIALLLITQPDFGMLVLTTAVFGIQLFVAGLPAIWIALACMGALSGIFAAYFMLPHVAARINNFLDPASAENYQVNRSLMAFENGGFYGTGPGEGTIKLHLPDSHTDFIFAVAGEELGAIISVGIICVFCFLVTNTLIRLLGEKDKFVQFASIGIITQIGLQSAINIGVTLNILPTKGMTLPFISSGGSSTIAIAVAMGMLLGMNKRATSGKRFQVHEIDV